MLQRNGPRSTLQRVGSAALLGLLGCVARSAAPPPTGSTPGADTRSSSGPAPAASAQPVGPEQARATQILERADLAEYHGWVRYLEFRAEHAQERFPDKPEQVREDRARLDEWTQRILEHPNLLHELRGVTEWAYLSPVDGSGQPFKLNIPTDYDPSKPAALAIYMHGYSGNHMEHAVGMAERTGSFEVAVLGRSRGGRYRALSEADVLGVLDYVRRNWAIDPSRVHLTGGSMGGAGTFWLGARYPDRFASARPMCGNATDKPLGNLLTLPIYATHSDDDWRVPILHSRGPIERLRALGANATLDQTTGYGHAVWDYAAGNERGAAWFVKQLRPDSRTLKHLDYTALDGDALGAYWAEVAEWGTEPRPAHYVLNLETNNRLTVRLDNVARLQLRIEQSPIAPREDLRVSVNGAPALTLPAPLPKEVLIERRASGWAFAPALRELGFRRHTPGGANQLYDGEPLLIVYGTQGPADVVNALSAAARVASHGSSAAWPAPNGEKGNDGVSHNQNLYGDLSIKADHDVTAEDIAQRHLVLLGSAAQNTVVAQLAARLPMQLDDREIRFSDGLELAATDRALGLVHYNPDAPTRLIFWVASNQPKAYRAGSLVAELLGAPLTGADAVVTRVSDPALVVSRSFDSTWHWLPRTASPLLPRELASSAELGRAIARSVLRAAPADFAVAGLPHPAFGSAFEPGEARLVDLIVQAYFEPMGVMTLRGSELLGAARAVTGVDVRLEPEAALGQIHPEREYRLALSAQQISPFVALTHLAPEKYRLSDMTVGQALSRYGVSAARGQPTRMPAPPGPLHPRDAGNTSASAR